MNIEIILPYPGLPSTKGTILDAQDEETPEDVASDETSDDTGDTGDEQAKNEGQNSP